jgi:cell division septation protein DedD
MADDRSRGVHLTDKQLVFVFMSATVVAVVVFLCGVLVGRGVQTARGPLPDATAMSAPHVVSDGGSGDAPVGDPAIRSGVASPAAAASEFTYAERLGKTPPPEQLKEPAQTPAPVPASREPVVPPEDPPEVPADGAGTPETSATGGDYTIQVAAVKKRAEADRIVKDLKAQGYDAYVFVPGGGDQPGVFRVRVGSFKDKQKADVLAQRLTREGKGYRPWVTR